MVIESNVSYDRQAGGANNTGELPFMTSTKISDLFTHLVRIYLLCLDTPLPLLVSAEILGLKSQVGGQVKPEHELYCPKICNFGFAILLLWVC